MSPEQCRGEPADERSDIYSLGITYFELLTGRPPFADTTAVQVMFAHCSRPMPDPRAYVSTLPAACAAIVRRATAKEPVERFQTVQEFLGAMLVAKLPDVNDDDQNRAYPTPSPKKTRTVRQPLRVIAESAVRRPNRTPTRRRWLLAALGGVVAVPFTLGGALLWKYGPWRTKSEPLANAEREWTMNGTVTALAISPQAEWLAAGTSDGEGGVVVWDMRSGNIKRRLAWGPTLALMFYHPREPIDELTNSDHLVGGGPQGPMLWLAKNDQDGTLLPNFEWGNLGTVRAVAHKAGARIVIGYAGGELDGTVKQYVNRNSGPDCLPNGPGMRGVSLAMGNADDRLAVVYENGNLVVFDASSGQRVVAAPTNIVVRAAAFLAEGVLAVGVGLDVRFWSANLTQVFPTLTLFHAITVMVTSPDGRWLVVGQSNGTVDLVAVDQTPRVVASWTAHVRNVRSVTFAPDSRWFVTGGEDHVVRRWDVHTRVGLGAKS